MIFLQQIEKIADFRYFFADNIAKISKITHIVIKSVKILPTYYANLYDMMIGNKL